MKRANDKYWRFDGYKYEMSEPQLRAFLRRSGYYCNNFWPRARLLEVARWKWTLRPDYRYVKRAELLKFVKDRKIFSQGQDTDEEVDPSPEAKLTDEEVSFLPGKHALLYALMLISVPQLRASLRTADASPEFHKFDDLPPELQVRVCEFYVSSFPVVLGRPTQPPLARQVLLFVLRSMQMTEHIY